MVTQKFVWFAIW